MVFFQYVIVLVCYCGERIDLAMTKETIIAIATDAGSLENEGRARIKWICRTSYRVGGIGESRLQCSLWHFSKLTEDQCRYARRMW